MSLLLCFNPLFYQVIMNQGMESSKNNIEEMGLKFGPITLMPDIEKRHLFIIFGAFFGIASMALVNVFGPLVLKTLRSLTKQGL